MSRSPRLLLPALLALWGVSVACAAPAVVTVEIFEKGVSKNITWPTQPVATESYSEDTFGLFELLPENLVERRVEERHADDDEDGFGWLCA